MKTQRKLNGLLILLALSNVGNALEMTAGSKVTEVDSGLFVRLESIKSALTAAINVVIARVKTLETTATSHGTRITALENKSAAGRVPTYATSAASSNGKGVVYGGWIVADMCALTTGSYSFGSATAGCAISQSGRSWNLYANSNSRQNAASCGMTCVTF